MDDIGVGQIFLVEQITRSKTYKQYPTVWLLQINLGFLIVRKCEKPKSFTKVNPIQLYTMVEYIYCSNILEINQKRKKEKKKKKKIIKNFFIFWKSTKYKE